MIRSATAPALACALLAAASPAFGQAPAADGRAGLVQRLADCRKESEDAARLACYDKAAAAIDQAEAKGDIVVMDREQARNVRRQVFGFTRPSLGLFEKGESREEIESLTSKVASAQRDGAGKWTVVLEDGAVWRQIDASEFFRTPKAGMSVRIRRAALGSFMMSLDNSPGFRARRVE